MNNRPVSSLEACLETRFIARPDRRSADATLKYGIPVGVGDTMGPTALARNLRTIPVVIDLVKRMEDRNYG